MSLQVLHAHTGQRLLADPAEFSSLESFKTWLGEVSLVPPNQQILLTAGGKQAKFPGLTLERELFLYNRQLISPSPTTATRDTSITPVVEQQPSPLPATPPSTIDQTDLHAWQELFNSRRNWARDILQRSRITNDGAQDHFGAITTIERAVGVAAGNLQSHVGGLHQKFEDAERWSGELISEPETLLARYRVFRSQLEKLPANASILKLLPKLKITARNQEHKTLLADFVNATLVDEAASAAKQSAQWVAEQVKTLQPVVSSVTSSAHELMEWISTAQTESLETSSRNVQQLWEEVEVISKKFDSDCDHAASLPASAKSLSQVAKIGAQHDRTHVPSLREVYTELVEHQRQAVNFRNAAASSALQHMQRIAIIEMDFAGANKQLCELDLPQRGAEAIDTLHLVSQIIRVYGFVVVEAVRRCEWADKLRSESAVLAEDIAGYQEEEERRRRKWLKSFGHSVSGNAAGGTAISFELNLQHGSQQWPETTRDTITQYLEALAKLAGNGPLIQELTEAVEDLDKPARRQLKTIKGFKMASIYETESGKGSFLLRGQDEVKALVEVNSKLQEELKSQKSRVRKLEDLLFKQGQPPRTMSGNLFQTDSLRPESPNAITEQLPSALSPKQEFLARKGSISTRRTSTNATADEKALARRIVSLEAELHDERRKRMESQTIAETSLFEATGAKAQLEEVKSTNGDLMANMEAQQREFADERRLLSADIERQKHKVDELEDELDHMIGSRENDRAIEDERARMLEGRLEQVLAEHRAELGNRIELEEDFAAKLSGIHSRLAVNQQAPGATSEILEAIDALVESATHHEKELTTALSAARSDNAALQTYLDKHEEELTAIRTHFREVDEAASTARSETANEKARADSLATDLDDGRVQLRILRAKFADGETGSEILRQRLEEQAAKASTLASQLAQSKSQVIGLDVELLNVQRKNLRHETEVSQLSRRLEHRAARDRDLTHRLAEHAEELTRLLESLGLSIVERDGTMSIQRTSKIAGASTTLTDPGMTTSPILPFGQPFNVSIDPALLQWMQSASEEDEKRQFTEFTARLDAFSLSKFSEAVIKLRRDVEWTGKKWKAEARSYREKFNRAQSETHDKIAYRSFKDGDLALFLPTRNQATRPWAAFNVGAPHYFLREQDSHKLQHREWLVARISKVEERVVDLSKPVDASKGSDGRSIGESESGVSFEDDNPFELSDGLRWYLLDAVEEKSGAPSTPGLGKSTLASVQRVDAKGSIRMKKSPTSQDASTKLGKSLESRRSSTSSKRGSISGSISGRALLNDNGHATATTAISFVPVSTAAEELQRVASLTNVSSARPASARSTAMAVSTSVAHPPSGLGIEVARANDEYIAVQPSSRSLLGPLGTASPPKSSWFGRNRSDTPTRRGVLQPVMQRSQNTREEVSPGPSPSKLPKQSAPSNAPHSVRNNSASPAKPRQAGEGPWQPLWSLDMSIEEGKTKK